MNCMYLLFPSTENKLQILNMIPIMYVMQLNKWLFFKIR